jgi:asparagine synthase (glutamine-hydrolysing)
MCGIWGICNPDAAAEAAGGAGIGTGAGMEMGADTALSAMAHRGPDSRGVWTSPDRRTTFGHVRLAIIDLSPEAHQPMLCADGRLAIVFNGEIYNFQELRRALTDLGEVFVSRSDTEVLLTGYKVWGKSLFSRLNGMFALAIYDARDSAADPVIVLARDRVGKKPLYYRIAGNTLEFASELKGILGRGRTVDEDALALYLGLGYVPGPASIVKGVSRLPAASWLEFSVRTSTKRLERYWSLPAPPPDDTVSEDDLLEELEYLLTDSVRLRFISDVPLGVFLSGGVDSSLVVAAAARQTGRTVKTFTITFPGRAGFDEAEHALMVARHFNTDHHTLEGRDFNLETLREWSRFVDEPLGDPSVIPTFWVSRMAREWVTVVLGGDGGDELFAGYQHYQLAMKYMTAFSRIPAGFWKSAAALAGVFPTGLRGRNTLLALREGPDRFSAGNVPCFDRYARKRLMPWSFPEVTAEDYLASHCPHFPDAIQNLTRLDFAVYLPDDIMTKVDRAGMACSLECRAPWLDYRLIEFAFGKVPSAWKTRHGGLRYLQRKLAERWLPSQFNSIRKQGFAPPLDELLRQESFASFHEFFSPLRGWIRPGALKSLWQSHSHGRSNGYRLFTLAMLGAAVRNLDLQAPASGAGQ